MEHGSLLMLCSGSRMGLGRFTAAWARGRLISRALLVAVVLLTLRCAPGWGAAWGQALPPAGTPAEQLPFPTDAAARREWLLQRYRDQLQLLERLERCRQAPPWHPELDGRTGPWSDCPMR